MIGRAFRVVFLGFLSFLTGLARAQQSSPMCANDLARLVVNRELQEQDHSRWMYRAESQKQNDGTEIDEVVETSDGNLSQPVFINGQQPSSEQQSEAERHNQQLANPADVEKTRKSRKEDQERTDRMLKLLPEAFTYTYAAERGDQVKMTFVPNPQFRPPSREAEVFHALEGYMWVDRRQKRLVEVAGRLIHKLKFGGGLLGHLDQGGTFDVKKEEVGPGVWRMTLLDVNMTGRVLFFKTITEHQKETRSDFQRMPENLTVVQASDILEKQVNSQLRASNRQNRSAARERSER
jgi:hypothetical protein